MQQRTHRPSEPVDLRLTLAPVQRGRHDPCMRIGADGIWRATRTPLGAATTALRTDAAGITMTAWGPGAPWAIEHLPDLVGAGDGAATFRPDHPLVAALARRLPGVRIPRTGAVLEALVPVICEQKVLGIEARRSYAALVHALGEPAPGPGASLGLRVPPAPADVATTPSWSMHPWGLERKRADTIRRAASVARRLEECLELEPRQAVARLCAVPGVGPWSAAEVGVVALGDADAVSVGDYHLPNLVSWNLAGEPRGDDARMLELLEPFRGHRARVIRLLAIGGRHAPRYGPRLEMQHIARL